MDSLESVLRCPSCGGSLTRNSAGWRCEADDIHFPVEESIPDFLLPWRRPSIERYLATYVRVRHAEGWGSDDPSYYLHLPFLDSTRRHKAIWRIRATTYETLLQRIRRLQGDGPLDILDLGAGNCWLSLRLVHLGHRVIAVDINRDPYDGLGVCFRVKARKDTLLPVLAEFDHLPFAPSSFDAIIFNASIHHAPDPLGTLQRDLSFLRRGGAVYIADSPIYRDDGSGSLMVAERQASIARRFNAVMEDCDAGSFLTFSMIEGLRQNSSVSVEIPRYGLRWRFRPALSALLGRREPASFAVVSIVPQAAEQLRVISEIRP